MCRGNWSLRKLSQAGTTGEAVDLVLGRPAQVGIDEQDLFPDWAMQIARLLAVVVLPSDGWALVTANTLPWRVRRTSSMPVRIDL